jgi:RNA polymerase sigma factor (sigma-70 family)
MSYKTIDVTKDCKEILALPALLLAETFQAELKAEGERIISCFYSCFQKEFIKWAALTYRSIPDDLIQFIANISFTDSVLLFTEKAKKGTIYDGNARVKTILRNFYWHKLRDQLQKEKRLAGKKEKFAADNRQKQFWTEDTTLLSEEYHQLLESALNRMEPIDRQIITWRHIELKSPDEIASLLAISKDAASNRIYRCMERLRNLTRNTR